MATIVYTNCKMFIDDTQIDAQLSEFSVDFKAEMLDVTTFGNDTRIKAGGLFTASMAGKGFFAGSAGVGQIDEVIFREMGQDEGSLTNARPVMLTVFPTGITAGTLTDFGYSMRGVLESFTLGGGVGIALPLSFSAQSRGVLQTV